jgi:carbamoyl-phosphate synthase large subunit
MPEKFHIAVTGLSAGEDPNPGFAAIECLREKKEWRGRLRIIGLAYDALDTGVHSPDLVDEVYLIPYATQGEGALIHRMREIRQRTPIDVLIPTLDGELVNFCRAEPVLRTLGIRTLLPSESQLKLHFKHALVQFCSDHGIPMPRTVTVHENRQLEGAARSLGLPLILKGILHEAYLAQSPTQAQAFFDLLRARWGLPILAQEYIPGDERDVVVLCDRKGKLVGMVAMKKLGISSQGKAWAGVTVKDEELLELSARIVRELEWVGPAELEFVRHSATGKPYLLEVNPRFPTWVYLAARAGQNLPAAAVQLALGRRVHPLDSYQEGVVYVRHVKDIICSIEQMAQLASQGELVLRKDRSEGPEPSGPSALKGAP